MMHKRSTICLLVLLIFCLSLFLRAAPVFASTGSPQTKFDDEGETGFWQQLFDDFSISKVLDLFFDYIDEQDQKMDDLFINSKFTESEKQQIANYSGGKSPAELSTQFCSDSTTSDAQQMFLDIRQTYAGTENDPKSPIHLIELFEKMSSFCE